MKAISSMLTLMTCLVATACIPSSHGFNLQGIWNNIKQILEFGTSFPENNADGKPSLSVDDNFGILWGMPDSEAMVGHLFKLTIPSNALKGDFHQYHFKINEAGSTSLPLWLYFNSSSYTFYGLPAPTDQGMVYIEIKAQSESNSVKISPVTMSFFIRVHMPNKAHLISNTNDLKKRDGINHVEKSKNVQCAFDENFNEVTLVLDTTILKITSQERIALLYKAAHFLGHNVNDISLMPKRNSVVAKLLDQQILVAGPGNVGMSTSNVGVELSWAVGCGEFTQANDVSRVMEHNIKNNLITTELGYNIIGWHVSQTQPPENIRKLRKRRQALAATPTPTVFSSLPSRVTDMSTYMEKPSAETTAFIVTPSVILSSDVSLSSSSPLEETASSRMSSTITKQPSPTNLASRETSIYTDLPSIATSMQFSSDLKSISGAFPESTVASSIQPGLSGTIIPSPTMSSMDISSFIPSPTYQSMPPATDKTSFSTITPVLSSVIDSTIESSMAGFDSSMIEPTYLYSEISSSYMSSSLDIVSTPVFISSSDSSSSPSTSYDATPVLSTSVATSVTQSYSLDSTVSAVSLPVSSSVLETISPSPTASSSMNSPYSSSSGIRIDETTILASDSSSSIASPTVVSPSFFPSVLPSTPVISSVTPSTLEPSQSPFTTSIIPTIFSPTPSLPSDSIISLSTNILSSTTSPEMTTGTGSSMSADIPSLTAVISVSSNMSTIAVSSSSDVLIPAISSSSDISTIVVSSNEMSTHMISSSSDISSTMTSSSSITESAITGISVSTTVMSSSMTVSSPIIPSSLSTIPVTSVLTSIPELTTGTSIASTPVSSSTTSVREYSTGEIIGIQTLITALPTSLSSSHFTSVPSASIGASTSILTSSMVSSTTNTLMSSFTPEIISTSTLVIRSSSTVTSVLPTSSIISTTTSLPPTTTSTSGITSKLPPITTSVMVTTESMTTLRPTTKKPVPTTEQLTTEEITTVAPNTAPIILNPIDKIQSILGSYFELRIPEDTFFDKEDGNTRKLNLTMYFANGSSLVAQSWVQFNSISQTVYGLPLAKDVTQLPQEFVLVAEDKGGLKIRDAFQIPIDVESVKDISYQFMMHFSQDFSTFMLVTKNYMDVVSKLGAYYGDNNSSLTTVTDIRSGSVIMSVTNNSISKVVCENDTILDLYRRMNSSGQLNLAFVRAMVPFAVEQVDLEWMGVCLSEPANATEGPTESPVIIGAGTNIGVIVAVILTILIIIIIVIILLCIYCRRRKQKGRYLPEDEKPIYGNNRKPVLLEDELELKDKNMRPKRPVLLSKDLDPLTYANEGYSPPADGGARQEPPSYIVPYDGGYGPTFETLDGPSPPPLYLPSPAAASSPFDRPPPEYKLPPPYIVHPGHSKA